MNESQTHLVKLGIVAGAGLLASCMSSGLDRLGDAPPVVANYAAILFATYDDSVTTATHLRAVATPLYSGTPTQAALDEARTAWRAARVPYQQSEIGRFYGGPIDDPSAVEASRLLNEWPLDEAAIDYVRGAGGTPIYGGMINMPAQFPSITGQVLAENNFVGGDHNVTTGYHAIEFLLWGQDFHAEGPGDRAFTDYVDGMQMNAARRREYLDAVTSRLIADLTPVRDAWTSGTPGNYRAAFLALPPHEAVHRMFMGLAKLASGEVGADRLEVPYTTKDQEDEHSCFSDNTSADLTNDIQGVANVYYGRYTRTDGTVVSGASLSDLVRARDAVLDARLHTQIDATLADLHAWPTAAMCPSPALQGMCPFDQLITGTDSDPGRIALHRVIVDLQAVYMSLLDAANTLGTPLTSADLVRD